MSTAGLTYLARHAQTTYSVAHRVNGSLRVDVPLSEIGRETCSGFAASWNRTVTSSVTSRFSRTRESAGIVLAGQLAPGASRVDRRLDEVDYGRFEGGDWMAYGAWLTAAGPDAVPPGGHETWRECVLRMLAGLQDCLLLPGPRLVVAHGLLSSVVRALVAHDSLAASTALPEAPYLEPVVLDDAELTRLVERGRAQLLDVSHAKEPVR
ncbi:histidine phosphatase family protein [Streptomyces umbrinus]